jgi:putative transposase
VAEVRRVGDAVGVNRAVAQLVELAAAGELPDQLQVLVTVANAKAGKTRGLSRSTLMRWMRDAKLGGAGALAPKVTGRDYTLEEDVAAVLALYRQPNKPSLIWCADRIADQLGVDSLALYHRANRYRKKIPQQVFHVGRHTGAALKALQPFRRRDFMSLAPNDVWVGDGHGAKLKVAHPVTGSPFVPEVTAILDVATRYCVGWSVSLSENCLAVADALRHSVSRHGVPLIYYSDNGGGQTNRMFDAPITGTLGRLGIHHETGRPGNPQGRGVIERFWQTTVMPLARQFETYQGKNADRETLRKVSIDIDRSLRAIKKGEVTALPRRLPSWKQFLDALSAAIEDYNLNHQHRSLPKLNGTQYSTPALFRAGKLAALGQKLHIPTGNELATLFMPAIRRKAIRGEVRLFNGIYFHKDLALVDGEEVQVCYDVHDVSRVWVKKLSGEQIAEALLDGNRDGYMPQPLIERLATDRAKRRLARVEAHADEIRAELEDRTLDTSMVLEPLVIEPENVVPLPVHAARSRPMFDTDAEKFNWLMEHTAAVTAEDESWIDWYRSTSEWEDLFGDRAGTEVAAR